MLRGFVQIEVVRPAGDDELLSVALLDRVEGHAVGAGPWRRYPAKLRTRASPINTAGRCCASITPGGHGVYANVELAKPGTGDGGLRHSGYSRTPGDGGAAWTNGREGHDRK